MLVINFKTHAKTAGSKGIKLAKAIAEASDKAVLVPQIQDTALIARRVDNPLFAQHVDPYSDGTKTGRILATNLKEAGCSGAFINHHKHKMKLPEIKRAVELCAEAGVSSVVCVSSTKLAHEVIPFKPEYLALLPEELMGSGVSITKEKPEAITAVKDTMNRLNTNIKLLCGGGVRTGAEVQKALELGADGVIVSSAVVNAEDPAKVVRSMAKYL